MSENSYDDEVYGLLTVQEANSLAALRFGSEQFAGLADPQKAAALQTAYQMLEACGRYDLPAAEDATDQSKRAQLEQALMVVRNGVGLDARSDLRAMGVKAADVVGEEYLVGSSVPIAPTAHSLMIAGGHLAASNAGQTFSVVRWA